MELQTGGMSPDCWRDDSGADSRFTVSRSGTLRYALLGAAATGALFFGYGRSVRAQTVSPTPQCTTSGTTVTCTGDVSVGVDVTNPGPGVTNATLNVNNLTTGIAPASGVRGISFTSDGDLTIASDTSPFDIATTGAASAGILARSINGAVTVTQTGDVSTAGAHSDGVYAYSVDGAVTITQTGDINTTGEGLEARTIDGGATVTHTGDIDSEGDGISAVSSRAATVTQTGNISTTGNDVYDSHGINAVSNGGGAVTVTQTGDISTTDDDSDGINAVSDGGGDIGITLNGGSITSAQSEGVEFIDGAANTLTINNTVSISGGTTDVLGGDGDETVNNFGTLTTPGDLDLGAGTNAFDNMVGAVFNSGTSVDLGPTAGNTLTNYGVLSPFGSGTVGTTDLTGNLVLDAGGVFAVDVDLAGGVADKIDMAGSGNASADGGLALNFLSLAPVPGGPFTIIGDATALPVESLSVLNPVVLADITYPGGTDLVLTIDGFDFSPAGLNRNRTRVGDNLNTAFGAGIGGLGPVLTGLANLTGPVAGALDQLSPEIYGNTQIAALYANMDFSDTLLSCGVNQPGTLSVNREGQCVWVAANVRYLDSDRTAENVGYDETSGLFAAGMQVVLAPDWRLGFGVGYQGSTLKTDTGATSDGDQVQGGVTVKYNPGALLLAGAVSGGRGWYDTMRPIAFDGFSATAEGDHEIDVLGGRLHASYVLGSPDFYFKPIFDVAVTRVELHDVTESGAGGAGLIVDEDDHTVFSASPAAEIGAQYWLADDQLIRPFVRAGVTWWSNDDVTLTASFAGAPGGVAPFAISAGMDELQADVAAGLEIITSGNNTFSLFYDGHFGETTRAHSVGIKGSLKF